LSRPIYQREKQNPFGCTITIVEKIKSVTQGVTLAKLENSPVKKRHVMMTG
jgi:hypothetical protein